MDENADEQKPFSGLDKYKIADGCRKNISLVSHEVNHHQQVVDSLD